MMYFATMIDMPSAATLKSYEALGIAGFLLGVLVVFFSAVVVGVGWAANAASRFLTRFTEKHLNQMDMQTASLLRMEIKQDHLSEVQNSWHRRLDAMLQCWLPGCPMKAVQQTMQAPRAPGETALTGAAKAAAGAATAAAGAATAAEGAASATAATVAAQTPQP